MLYFAEVIDEKAEEQNAIKLFKEIYILDGHDYGACFWIMPVRIIDYSDTNDLDNVAEIPIEEDDAAQYLTPFLHKYFDGELEANRHRLTDCWSVVVRPGERIHGHTAQIRHSP